MRLTSSLTDQPCAYAGDDPVNEADPSGLSTEGYCASFSVFAAVVGGAATDCIVKTPNGDSVGITATVAVTAGFDSATLIGGLGTYVLNSANSYINSH